MPPTTCTGHNSLPCDTPIQCPGSPGTPIPQPSAQIVSHTSVKSRAPPAPGTTRPPAPAAPGSWHLPLPLTTSQGPIPLAIWEKDGKASGEGPGWGQEGRMPVGRPPVCPQLILAAFSLAWQSGPVAPAVILRFLGHCHAGLAAKWGAGGAGAQAGPRAGKETCAGSMAGMGVCAGVSGGVSSLLPAYLRQCGAAAPDHWSTECACGL